MFDRLIRYLPVLDYIRKNKPTRILEVGCSSRGLGEWWEGKFTGCDMDFPEKTVKNMKAVVGSADKLPFPDKSFDLVFCLDVFEHLPKNIREKALGEMLRVSKGAVIVGYPCGKGAEKLSQKMLAWFEARKSGTARWMREHVSFGLPSEKFPISNFQFPNKLQISNSKNNIRVNPLEIRVNRAQSQIKVREYDNENLKICEILLKLEENPRFVKLERLLFRHFRPLVEAILRRLNYGKCYRKIWVLDTIPEGVQNVH